MRILGIETSCDDTCAAIVEASGGSAQPRFRVRANIISSQVRVHRKFGGVVPSLAARAHAENIVPVLRRACKESGSTMHEVDLIAVTTHPGLLPSLIIGVHAARTLAWATGKPILGIDHLEGHIVANLLSEGAQRADRSDNGSSRRIAFPAIGLIVSGGHTQLVLLRDLLRMRIIGETRDDAAGEAFDKVAKLLGLPFPGGPPIAAEAAKWHGGKTALPFPTLPRPMTQSRDYDFSFAGLKTAVLYTLRDRFLRQGRLSMSRKHRAALCYAFEQAVVDVLVAKTIRAAKEYRARSVLLGGGVAANRELRRRLGEALARELPETTYHTPPIPYALDNGAMIAAAAYLRWQTMTRRERERATWQRVRVRA